MLLYYSNITQEWLNFVEREKTLRSDLEARVEQAIADATGLREWAAIQVQGVRKDVEEEIELLLEALKRKNEALEDAHARLTTRLRWGVALLEAKKAALLGRRALLHWCVYAGRQRHNRSVVAKLEERSDTRHVSRAWQAWITYTAEQQVYQAKIRAAVKKMSHLKMFHVFQTWRHAAQESREEAMAEAAATALALNACYVLTLSKVFSAWKYRSRCAAEATRRLDSVALRTRQTALRDAFAAWKSRVADQKSDVAGFEQQCMHSCRHALLQSAIDSWRVSVDDTFGGRMQLMHAVRFMSRRRTVRVLHAWQDHIVEANYEQQQWSCVVALYRHRVAVKALTALRDFAFERRGNREVFVSFVHARAERRMAMVLSFWHAHTQHQQYAAAVVRDSVQRRAVATLQGALSSWRNQSALSKINRHRVAVCQRRHRINTLKNALLGWKDNARQEIDERNTVAAFGAKIARNRLATALVAFREHAHEEIQERTMHAVAAGWHAGRLHARVLWALQEAVSRHQDFASSLMMIRDAMDRASVKSAWNAWQQVVGEEEAKRQMVLNFQRRRSWFSLKHAVSTWKARVQEEQRLRLSLFRCTERIAVGRSQWVFDVWRQVTAQQVEEDSIVSRSKQRLQRKLLSLLFASWRQRTEYVASVVDDVDAAVDDKSSALVRCCMDAWAAHTTVRIEQRAGVVGLVHRRAESLQRGTFLAWFDNVREEKILRQRSMMASNKVSAIKASSCFAAWKQHAEDSVGERIKRIAAGTRLADAYCRRLLCVTFSTWRARSAEVAAGLATFEARRLSQSTVVMKFAFASWSNLVEREASRRDRTIDVLAKRNTVALLRISLLHWRHETKTSSRNALVSLHAAEKWSLAVARRALEAWQDVVESRRARRAALMLFLQRTSITTTHQAFSAWREVVAQRTAARNELSRCIIRKRLAFQQFKQWYWESFDEDLQATLQAMFVEHVGEGEEARNLLLTSGPLGNTTTKVDERLSDTNDMDAGNAFLKAALEGKGPSSRLPSHRPGVMYASGGGNVPPVDSILNAAIQEDLRRHAQDPWQQRCQPGDDNSWSRDIADRVRSVLADVDASPRAHQRRVPSSIGNDIFEPMKRCFDAAVAAATTQSNDAEYYRSRCMDDENDAIEYLGLSPVQEINETFSIAAYPSTITANNNNNSSSRERDASVNDTIFVSPHRGLDLSAITAASNSTDSPSSSGQASSTPPLSIGARFGKIKSSRKQQQKTPAAAAAASSFEMSSPLSAYMVSAETALKSSYKSIKSMMPHI